MSSLEGPVHPARALTAYLKKMVAVLFCMGNVLHWARVLAELDCSWWYYLGKFRRSDLVGRNSTLEFRICATSTFALWIGFVSEDTSSHLLVLFAMSFSCYHISLSLWTLIPLVLCAQIKFSLSEFPCLSLLSPQQRDPETIEKLSERQVTQILKLKIKFTTTALKYWQAAL